MLCLSAGTSGTLPGKAQSRDDTLSRTAVTYFTHTWPLRLFIGRDSAELWFLHSVVALEIFHAGPENQVELHCLL